MSLFDKKQQLQKPEIPRPIPKEMPKETDTSAFSKKKALEAGEVRRIVQSPQLFSKYGLRGKEGKELGQKMTDYKKFGQLFQPQDAHRLKKELLKERFKTLDSAKRAIIDKDLRVLKDKFGV